MGEELPLSAATVEDDEEAAAAVETKRAGGGGDGDGGGKGGWIKRAEEFMRPKYRMTDSQFNRRVSAWA